MINRRSGFTLIELLITMVIVTILLTLVVVSLRSTQASARDEERKTDIAVIAQQLEDYYISNRDHTPGRQYPATPLMAEDPPRSAEEVIRSTLRDLDPKALRAPGIGPEANVSLVVATDNSPAQTPTTSTYIYQPLRPNGNLCTTVSSSINSECRSFILYYMLETESGVQTLRSKHQ